MQSRAKTVTEYMKEAPAGQLDILTDFREICMRNLPGFKESMEFGMPSYLYNGNIEVAWQSQKNQVTLMIQDEDIFKNFKPLLKGMETGKNSIHFKKLDQVDLDLITALIQQVAKVKNAILV